MILIGPTPPPVGGVSIHVERFSRLLNRLEIPCLVISTTSLTSSRSVIGVGGNVIFGVLQNLPKVRGKLVLIHSSELTGTIVALLCEFAGAKAIQFFHNGRALQRASLSGVLHLIWGGMLRRLSAVFAVNSDIKNDVASLSDGQVSAVVVNPFIPPQGSELNLGAFATSFQSENIYVGWCGIASGERAGIYGLDFFLDAVSRVADFVPRVVAVIGAGGELDLDVMPKSVADRVRMLSRQIVVVPPEVPFAAVMTKLSVFVRPTLSDGDAVSVREALALGARVLASDVVNRPDDVEVYKGGDLEDCVSKLVAMLDFRRIHGDASLMHDVALPAGFLYDASPECVLDIMKAAQRSA